MQNAFVYGATVVQFPKPPKYGEGTGNARVQPHDWSLGGTLYVYDRDTKIITHNLVFDGVPDGEQDNMELLADSQARGAMRPFIWYDRAGAAHTVTMPRGYRLTYPFPGKGRLEVTLEEYL